jgi:hypothetical protein
MADANSGLVRYTYRGIESGHDTPAGCWCKTSRCSGSFDKLRTAPLKTVSLPAKPQEMRKKGAEVNYRVHRLEVKENSAQEKLEGFLNRLEGDVVSIVPYVTPVFKGMGATAKVGFLLIVEQAK